MKDDSATTHQPLRSVLPSLAAPTFYVMGRQPLRPGAIFLAVLIAVGGLGGIVYAMAHTEQSRFSFGDSSNGRSSGSPSSTDHKDDDDDDPNQVDTIVLGDPADAPVPGRRGDHVSPVHPTILIHLPRYGDQVGLIPDTPAGHLLYSWLAAFNQTSSAALSKALPGTTSAAAAQMKLRHHTGGFNLLSAKEVQPGVLVFRLRDQTPLGTEALGTLLVRPDSNPAAIASFSVRAVPPPAPRSPSGSPPLSGAAPQ